MACNVYSATLTAPQITGFGWLMALHISHEYLNISLLFPNHVFTIFVISDAFVILSGASIPQAHGATYPLFPLPSPPISFPLLPSLEVGVRGFSPENFEILHCFRWVLAHFWSKKYGFWPIAELLSHVSSGSVLSTCHCRYSCRTTVICNEICTASFCESFY